MRKLLTLLLLPVAMLAGAQIMDPVHFTATLEPGKGGEADIVFRGEIDEGWHVYATGTAKGGPTWATLHADRMEGAALRGALTPKGRVLDRYDEMFGMQVRYFEGRAEFRQHIVFTKPTYNIEVRLEYGACDDENCLPPSQVTLRKSGKSPAIAADAAAAEQAKAEEAAADTATADTSAIAPAPAALAPTDSALWAPVSVAAGSPVEGRGLLWFLLLGFMGGLVALFTPCVWPIIPMTVSFFLKRAKGDRSRGIRDALTYGAAIVVIYLTLGLAVTAIWGPSKLNELSTNAVFNIFFCLLLVVFALSFFGWFEIRLPEKWGNAVDSKASGTTGLLSIFLMAFTLTLVSFSCTGPIIGFLLVDFATAGAYLGPTVGMLGFALALALPFTLFALFPGWLKSAPRSGSWMNNIKVVLGFVELAFALKFLSVADLAYGWHIMDREVFLSLWIIIFALMGCYLVGWLRFRSDEVGGEPARPMPVAAIMLGMATLAFALYMVPGLWGAPCKAVSAFAPPMSTQDFNLYTREVHPQYTDYDQGMAAAREQGKPALLDFTGFGCVNCREMEAAVWTDPAVARMLTDDYVLISLYVDDKTPLAQPMEVVENGQQRTLRTVGDKWSYLQRHKFGANAQPFYIPVSADGKPLAPPYSYKKDVKKYTEFLQGALKQNR